MVKQIKKDNMRTTIVIFTDHKVSVSEIPNYKKYKFLCNYDLVKQYDMIEDPRYCPQMMVVGFDPSTKRRQKGLVLKDIYITRINGKCINQPIGLINGSIPETYHNLNKREAITEESRTIKVTLEQAREWYNSNNLALRTLALSTFKESELNIDLEYIMTAIIDRRKIFPLTAKEVTKQQTLAHLKFIAEYFNKTWEKTTENAGYFIGKLYKDGEIEVFEHKGTQHAGIIYFKNPEDAEKAIKILGKEVLNLF